MMSTIDNLEKIISSKYNVTEGKPGATTTKGNQYVVLTSNGIKPEGESFGPWIEDPEQAARWFLYELDKLSKGKKNLVFRSPLEISMDNETGGFMVRARLVFE